LPETSRTGTSGIVRADTYFPLWGGALIGGALGTFFGLALGGALPRAAADWCFGPEEETAGRERPYQAKRQEPRQPLIATAT
jgi:hypothetical protein